MQGTKPDFSELWIQHQHQNNKTTPTWACIFCIDRRIFSSEPELWEHAKSQHPEPLNLHDGDGNLYEDNEAFREPMLTLDTTGKTYVRRLQLWCPDQDPLLTKAFFNDPSNVAFIQLQKSRAKQLQSRSRKSFRPLPMPRIRDHKLPKVTQLRRARQVICILLYQRTTISPYSQKQGLYHRNNLLLR